MASVLQELQNARLKEKELQAVLDEQQQQQKIKEDEKSKAIQVKHCMEMVEFQDAEAFALLSSAYPDLAPRKP